jgi:hypothetical protein
LAQLSVSFSVYIVFFFIVSVLADYAARLENLFSTAAYAQICRAVFGPRQLTSQRLKQYFFPFFAFWTKV